MFDIPFLDLPPLDAASGTVQLPGSKSISNRVLLLAGLAQGCTRIHDLLDSDDTRVMQDALRTLGCGLRRVGKVLEVTGLGGTMAVKEADLFLGNAGTAMRPLAAALAVLATTQGGRYTLRGVPRMHERPIGDLVDALRPLGCSVTDLGQAGYPPLQVSGQADGVLATAEPIRVRGDVSSQFLTALLLALPLARSAQPVDIEVVGELISKPYIEITLNLMKKFGIKVQPEGWQKFTIPANSSYVSPKQIFVEGDASSASYFLAAGAIAGIMTVDGISKVSIQGDIRFTEALEMMGAEITYGENHIVCNNKGNLKAIDLDCNHIPDAAMTLAILALFAEGTTTLRNIASWRVKETDRISAMATELRKVGASVEEGADYIKITPPAKLISPEEGIDTYDDHRMAMCFSLVSLGERGVDIKINDPNCVAKTFPDYFKVFKHIAT